MDSFEFLFSLFGLVLGLSLAEVLHGFSKAVKARQRIRIGWLTPLLGMLVMLDVISFWTAAWALRDTLSVIYLTLMLMLLFSGAYYLAAGMVFPEEPDQCADYDDHYRANKKLVVGAVFALNVPNFAVDVATGMVPWGATLVPFVLTLCFLALLSAIFFTRSDRKNLVMLGALVSLYVIAAAVSGFFAMARGAG